MSKAIADALRDEIRRSNKSAAALARATGVPQQTISEFLKGRDMRLSRAQKLADYFGLVLRRRR